MVTLCSGSVSCRRSVRLWFAVVFCCLLCIIMSDVVRNVCKVLFFYVVARVKADTFRRHRKLFNAHLSIL